MPKRFCLTQHCPNYAEPKRLRCLIHARQHVNEWNKTQRDPEQTRFYKSTAWQRFRKHKLAQQPMCQWSEEPCSQGATDVDHITPMDQGGDALTDSNTQCLCKRHHSIKSARENR